MMFETFEHIIGHILEAEKTINKAYKGGVDLINLVDHHNSAIYDLLGVYYGEEGKDWIDWFLFEKFNDKNEPLPAYDKDGKEICKTLHELWVIVEDLKKSPSFIEYIPKKPMTRKDKIKFLNSIFGIKPSKNGKKKSN